MINNYEILPNGVIKQIDVNKIKYGYNYSNNYNQLGEIGRNMSYLRFGYMLGKLNHIPNSILDVGYGNGDFLNVCSKIIPKCYGNDITSEYPLNESIEIVNDIYENEYDIVCFFDVLEHFDDIYDIKKLKTKYIYISLPWCHNYNDEWFYNWKHRKPNEHLYHFNDISLINFFNEIGYSLIGDTSNIEDTIRKDANNKPNILTAIFKKNE